MQAVAPTTGVKDAPCVAAIRSYATAPTAEAAKRSAHGSKVLRSLFGASLHKLRSWVGLRKFSRKSKELQQRGANASAHAMSAHGGFLQWRAHGATPDPSALHLRHAASASGHQLKLSHLLASLPDTSSHSPPTNGALSPPMLRMATASEAAACVLNSPTGLLACTAPSRVLPCDTSLPGEGPDAVGLMALSAPEQCLHSPCGVGMGGHSAGAQSPLPRTLTFEACLSAPNLASSFHAASNAQAPAAAAMSERRRPGHTADSPRVLGREAAAVDPGPHGLAWSLQSEGTGALPGHAEEAGSKCTSQAAAALAGGRHRGNAAEAAAQQGQLQLPGLAPHPPQPQPPVPTQARPQPQAQPQAETQASPHLQSDPPYQAARASEAGTLLAMARTVPHAMWRAVWSMDDYSITRRVFKGSKASVYKAICNRSGLPVALKIYFLERVPVNTLHQIAREIQIQVGLAHRSILNLYGAFQDSKRLVLVMELAGRGDLHRLHGALQGGRLPEAQLRGLVVQPLLEALSYLHSRGVCHRDIKPENLLFASDWSLRLADFGVAINLAEERAVTRAGTADYMAPEVERCPLKAEPGDNKEDLSLAYSTAADVWSVGVLAYELLVGFPPVLGRGGAAGPSLSFPASVSAAARDFIAAALAPEPEDRPTVQQLRAHAWLAAGEDSPVAAV